MYSLYNSTNGINFIVVIHMVVAQAEEPHRLFI